MGSPDAHRPTRPGHRFAAYRSEAGGHASCGVQGGLRRPGGLTRAEQAVRPRAGARRGETALTDGVEELAETVVTVYTQQTLPVNHEFIGSFDPTDPVVRANNEVDYMSFRQLAITRFPSQERRMCYRSIRQGLYAQFRHMLRRAADLLTQAAIPWGRQIRLVRVDHGRRSGSIYLCGEGKDDTFAACVTLRSRDDRCCTIDLYTTETPQPHQEGPLRFPQTLQLARQLLGNDEQTLFGDLAIQVRAFGPLPRKVMALMAAGMTTAQAWATLAPQQGTRG
mmetsp:Transcript_16051/g.45686  ORF Transcript_16051/g.45686 Transcript_16051/m.45686 type:complete len:280 (-) Transcript_16051:1627-2466(-)